jgi:hypothetical protein
MGILWFGCIAVKMATERCWWAQSSECGASYRGSNRTDLLYEHNKVIWALPFIYSCLTPTGHNKHPLWQYSRPLNHPPLPPRSCVYHVTFATNSGYSPDQDYLIGVCNGDAASLRLDTVSLGAYLPLFRTTAVPPFSWSIIPSSMTRYVYFTRDKQSYVA